MAVPVLVMIAGPQVGCIYELTGNKYILGRHPESDIVLDVGAVSRHHAQVCRDAQGFYIEDLRSRNGTFVCEERVSGRRTLNHGDEIRICDIRLMFHRDRESASATATPRVTGSSTFHVRRGRQVTHIQVDAVAPLVAAGGLSIPDYLAPQQIDEQPKQEAGPWIDLHAMAVMMFEMLLGKSPLPPLLYEKLCAIVHRRYPSASELCNRLGYPEQLARTVDDMLRADWKSAVSVRNSIRSCIGAGTMQADAVGTGDESAFAPRPGERFRLIRPLFEDSVSDAFEAAGEESQARVTLRFFKPSFQSPPFVELAARLGAFEALHGGKVPRSILRRFGSGRAWPMPAEVGSAVAIVPLSGSEKGCLCLVEEFAGQRTLMSAIRAREFVGQEARIARIADQILDALEFAHTYGCLHENLTPYCIFLDEQDRVKVEGFGLHAQVESIRMEGGGDSSVASSSICARPASMPPEVKLRAIAEMRWALDGITNLDRLFVKVFETLRQVFPVTDRGMVILTDGDRQATPRFVYARRESDDGRVRFSRTAIQRVIHDNEPYLGTDASLDSRFEMSQSIADFRIRSLMIVPLRESSGMASGALQVEADYFADSFTRNDLSLLVELAAIVSAAIENAKNYEIRLRQQEVQRELRLACRLTRGLMPRKKPDVAEYRFFHCHQPSDLAGGDYVDYVPLPDGRIVILVADAVGKGISATTLLVRLAGELWGALHDCGSPSEAMARVNERIVEVAEQRFITAVMVTLDPVKHRASIVNAGHYAPLHQDHRGEIRAIGEGITGLPLGIDSEVEYESCEHELQPGDLLLLYTDGLVDEVDLKGTRFSSDRLGSLLRAARGEPGTIGAAIVADWLQFRGELPQHDDMSLVCFGRSKEPGG